MRQCSAYKLMRSLKALKQPFETCRNGKEKKKHKLEQMYLGAFGAIDETHPVGGLTKPNHQLSDPLNQT